MDRAGLAAVAVAGAVQRQVRRTGDEQPGDDQDDRRNEEKRPYARTHGEDASSQARYPQARAEPRSRVGVGGCTSMRDPLSMIERAYLAALGAIVSLLVRIALDP